MFAKYLEINYEECRTDCIPRSATLDDLVGSSSAFCACVPYICMVFHTSTLEIGPTETNSPSHTIFLLNTTNQKHLHEFPNLEAKIGKGMNLLI